MNIPLVFLIRTLTIICVAKAAKRTQFYATDIDSPICIDPVINSANRFTNMTVRLYRDDEYWDLSGLPDRQAFFSDHGKIWHKNMAPIKRNTTIVTILEGPKKDRTYKFMKEFFWTWDQNGELASGGRGGEYWDQLPTNGFTTAFHNANQTNPMIIALKDDKVFYYSTKTDDLDPIGNSNGYIGGKFGENFPPYIDAAFTWPKEKPIGEFNIYIFKEDKYCLRDFNAPKSGNYCDEWRENKELFGCLRGLTTISDKLSLRTNSEPTGQTNSRRKFEPLLATKEAIGANSEAPEATKGSNSGRITCVESSILLLFSILLVLKKH